MIPGWLDEIEEDVLSCLGSCERMSARDLAAALGVSETCAAHYLYLLASEGRLAIEVIALAPKRITAATDPVRGMELDEGMVPAAA